MVALKGRGGAMNTLGIIEKFSREPKVKRIVPGDNMGISELILREL